MTPAQIDRFLWNALAALQAAPERYRLFGVWWWPVKALLRARFGQAQLHLLGKYEDAVTAAEVPRADLSDTLVAAIEEYGHNLRYGAGAGQVYTPDGELVTIYDEDAGL